MRKRLASMALMLTLALLCAATAFAVTPEDYDSLLPQLLEEGYLYGESAVLLDGVTGRVLFSKNARERMYPASTTKIMTVLVALESGIDLDTPIIVPQQAAKIPKDSTLVPVFPGDQMRFGDLLYGCMLASGNDAANAVAVLVAGSVDAFVERMNARARELGCADTHFVNAHGYHDDDHYTTAMDLARITQAALTNDQFRLICACERYTFSIRRDREDIAPTRANTNVLLNSESNYYYADCIGVKTGTHSMAGNCFVGAAERDGVRLVAVTLKCPQPNDKWNDVIRMFNYGYTRYRALSLEQLFTAATGRIATLKISNAISTDPYGGTLDLRIADISNPDYTRMVPLDVETAMDEAVEDFVSRTTMTITHSMAAPVTAGEIMGQLRYVSQSGEEITARLIAGRDVQAQPRRRSLSDFFPFIERLQDPLVRALLIVLAVLVALLILAAIVRRLSRQHRRDQVYRVRRHEALLSERAENKRRRDEARRRREAVARERRARWDKRARDGDDDYDAFDDEDRYDEYDDDRYDEYDDN